MSDFFLDVIEVVKLIPKGKVTTCGRIAKYLGSFKSSRSVGWALNNNKLDDTVPAHRVVNRKGLLTGRYHFSKPDFMKNKLMDEGVLVNNNRVLNLNKHIWDPIKDLTL